MAWEPVIPQKNVTYLSIGNNLTLCIKQTAGEEQATAEVLFIPAIGTQWDVVDSKSTLTSAEELTAFMAQWLKPEAKHHVENV